MMPAGEARTDFAATEDKLDQEFDLLLGRWEHGNVGTSIVYCGDEADNKLDQLAAAAGSRGWKVLDADFSSSDLIDSVSTGLEKLGSDDAVIGIFDCSDTLNQAAVDATGDGAQGLLLVFKNLDALSPVELNQVMQASHRSNQKATKLALLASADQDIVQKLADATSYGSRLYSIIGDQVVPTDQGPSSRARSQSSF